MNPSGRPGGLVRRTGRPRAEETPDPRHVFGVTTVFLSLRQNRPKGTRDAHRLVEFLNRSLDVVGGLEHGIGVQNEFNVRVELPRLTLECWRLADRLPALNRR